MAHSFRLAFKFAHMPHPRSRWPAISALCAATLGFCFVQAAQTPSPPSYPTGRAQFHSVFGQDERQEIVLENTNLQAIGRIELQPEGVIPWLSTAGVPICTGTLVALDIVLTNAHCVMDRASGQLSKNIIWFRPAYGKDSAPRAAQATKLWLGTLQPTRDRSLDWALLRLDQPYGETYSWLPLTPLWEDSPFAPTLTSLVAYATDFKDGAVAHMHRHCSITDFDRRGSYFRHDCDMNAGSSGGPLLLLHQSGPQILAINAAHIEAKPLSYIGTFSPALANIAIGSTRFAAVLKAIQEESPLPSQPPVHVIDLNPPILSQSKPLQAVLPRAN